jgi:hypothetical protein
MKPSYLRRPAGWRLAILAGCVVASALALLASVTSASTQSPSRAALTFTTKVTYEAVTDKSFPRPGDDVVEVSENHQHGHVIGRDYTVCFVIDRAGALKCTTTVGLPGGTIEVAFRSSLTGKTITTPITGGSGRYATVRGYFTLRKTGPKTHLVTPHLS